MVSFDKKDQQVSSREPFIEGFRIEAKMLKGTQEIIDALSPLQFLDIVETKTGIAAINIERRDIQKNPYLFSIIYLNPDNIEIIYSYNPDESPKKRRLEILRYFLNIVTLLENVYFINHKQLYQVVDNFLSRLLEYTSSTYEELFSKYDSVKEECDRIKKQLVEVTAANESLRKSNMELKEQQNQLMLRIKELEMVSDDVLISRIQTWLDEHNYEINISDFARINKVSEQRVEEILNKMVREGYLVQRE
ncbi:MAG: hypothetical protein QXK21_00830 [Candidatus Micrarchaeia archaeon]